MENDDLADLYELPIISIGPSSTTVSHKGNPSPRDWRP